MSGSWVEVEVVVIVVVVAGAYLWKGGFTVGFTFNTCYIEATPLGLPSAAPHAIEDECDQCSVVLAVICTVPLVCNCKATSAPLVP